MPPEGVAIFFSGFSGAGKTTLARSLHARVSDSGMKQVTLLDDDMFRFSLSSSRDFAREFRQQIALRMATVAAEIAKSGGVALCSTIGPTAKGRMLARRSVERCGRRFVLVYLSTSLEVCESRDCRGLYSQARSGQIDCLTGITDDYEPPIDADLVIDTASGTVNHATEMIFGFLFQSELRLDRYPMTAGSRE